MEFEGFRYGVERRDCQHFSCEVEKDLGECNRTAYSLIMDNKRIFERITGVTGMCTHI